MSELAGFLADANAKNTQGIILAFMTALEINNLHDIWVVDSGATDHVSNKLANIHNFKSCLNSSCVSVANGKDVPIKGKGKIRLLSDSVASDVLYIPSFPFQLLSVR